MEAYTGFARVYDRFMDNIDYDLWCGYLIELLKENGISGGTVVDLGCGTGNITGRLCKGGYDMIGIDNSPDMLSVAVQKLKGEDILYSLQDMRNFELNGKVSAAVSICDSINYITEYEDLVRVFKRVEKYLDDKGIFIFDLKTKIFYSRIGQSVIAEDRQDCSFIWDNYFDEEDCINEYVLSVFVRGEDGRCDKYSEMHYQRAYFLKEIKMALEEAGLKTVSAFNAFTREEATEENERIYMVACKNNGIRND